MADENTEIQEQTQDTTPQQQSIQFEDILPWGTTGGDTGLSSRLKLKRNFEKIKAWMDSFSQYLNLDDKYLSKTKDDEAAGEIGFLKGLWIKAKGLFGWDSEGNITANNVTAEEVNADRLKVEKFSAHQSMMNEVYSDNFNWDYGMNGTGFILTKFGPDNNAVLALDDLVVRGKMTVNTLEIREETYTGGNQHWSPAGSVIFRVDYLDENGEPLGYQTVAAPWLLNGEAFFTSSAQIAYATRQQVRELIGERINEVATFRCYIVANNGTTSTRNFWCIGDQARCQTYNIVTRDKRDGETTIGAIQSADPLENIPIDQKDGEKTMENVFYWRILTGVGTATLEDGKPYNYIDLPNKDVYENGVLVKKMFAEGSDIPAAGDTLVCFGNDRNRDRMGIVSIETYNGANESTSSIDETPAIKMYAGVNKFSTNGNRTGIISPGKVEFDTAVFRLVTHSGSKTPIPNPRGAWAQNTAYFYYDIVQHNGSSWQCVVSDEYVWVEGGWTINDAFWHNISSKVVHPYNEGELNAGESGYQGSKGHEIGHRENIWTLVQKYTMDEPSSSSQLWTLYASKGNDGTRGNFKSRVFCRTNDTPTTPTGNVTTIGAITYNTYNNPVPPPSGSQGQYVWTDGIPTNSDAQIWSTICTFYGGGGNSGWSTPAPESDTADLDLEFSLSESETPPLAPSGNTPHSDHSGEGWYDPSLNQTLPSGKTWADMIWRAERKIKNGEYDGDWVTSRIKGEKGDPGEISPEDKQEIIAEIESELPSGITVVFDPNVIIVDQTDVAEFDKTGGINRSKLTVYQNGELIGINISNISCTGGTAGVYASATGNLQPLTDATEVYISLDTITTKSGTQSSDYDYAYDNGKITFVLTIGQGTEAKSYALSIKWYLNRLGRRITETKGDIEKTYMSRTEYHSDGIQNDSSVNLLRGTKNPSIGESTLSNNNWDKSGNSYLTIETISNSPVDGYNKAFRVATSSYKFKQIGDFWNSKGTYKFSAFARGINGNATVAIELSQVNSSAGFIVNDIIVGTEWQYISFVKTIPGLSDSLPAIFGLGIKGSGTIEYIAPTIIDITSPSVLRVDYEGQIQTSASGIDAKFTSITDDLSDDLDDTKENVTELSITAQGLSSRVSSVENVTVKNLFDSVENSAWEYWAGGTVNYDSSKQSVYRGDMSGNVNAACASIWLNRNETYVFSFYAAQEQQQPTVSITCALFRTRGDRSKTAKDAYIEGDSYKNLANYKHVLTEDTYEGCVRYYYVFKPYDVFNSGLSPIQLEKDDFFKLYITGTNIKIFYRPQLEISHNGQPSAWGLPARNFSSEIKQMANSIEMIVTNKLAQTGVIINGDDKRIEMLADKTIMKDSVGNEMISFEMYEGVPSLVFYDSAGKSGGQKAWVLNWFGLLQVINNSKGVTWTTISLSKLINTGRNITGEQIWKGTNTVIAAAVNRYIFHAAYTVTPNGIQYNPTDAAAINGYMYEGNSYNSYLMPTAQATDGWLLSQASISGDVKEYTLYKVVSGFATTYELSVWKSDVYNISGQVISSEYYVNCPGLGYNGYTQTEIYIPELA